MYCGHARLCVCVCVSVLLSAAVRRHYCTDPDVTWGRLLGGFAIGARVALLWQHSANPSYKLASIPRYDDIVRTAGRLGGVCARRRPVTGGRRGAPPKPRAAYGKRARPGGRRPAAEGGVLNITAAVWNAGFHWWRSGNKKLTQNVSEYMLVLALCLVSFLRPGIICINVFGVFHLQCIEG